MQEEKKAETEPNNDSRHNCDIPKKRVDDEPVVRRHPVASVYSTAVEKTFRREDFSNFHGEFRHRRFALDDLSPQPDLRSLMIASAHFLATFNRVLIDAVCKGLDPSIDIPTVSLFDHVKPPAQPVIGLARKA